MIFFDVETTGLIENEYLGLDKQPRIIEIGALKTDDDGNEIARYSTLVHPEKKLPEIITKITGIKDEDLIGAPLFSDCYKDLAEFFVGEKKMLAHNARFDLMCLVFELMRMDKLYNFPFCIECIDTRTKYGGKLEKWAKLVKNDAFVQTHRAIDDVITLRDCWFSKYDNSYRV